MSVYHEDWERDGMWENKREYTCTHTRICTHTDLLLKSSSASILAAVQWRQRGVWVKWVRWRETCTLTHIYTHTGWLLSIWRTTPLLADCNSTVLKLTASSCIIYIERIVVREKSSLLSAARITTHAHTQILRTCPQILYTQPQILRTRP